MDNKRNIDRFLLFLLPPIIPLLFFIFDGKPLLFSILLTISIFFYEAVTYHRRIIFSLSGIKVISIPAVAYLAFTIFIAIPAVYIATINTNRVYEYFFSVISFYYIYPVGLFIGDIIRTIDHSKLTNLSNDELKSKITDTFIYHLLIGLLLICLIGVALYLYRVDTIPLFAMIKNPGDAARAALLREESLKLLDVTIFERYYFHWLRAVFFPLGILGSLFLSVAYKKLKYYTLFAIFFVVGVFYNSLTLEKSPAAALILIIIAFLFLRKKKIRFRFIIIAMIAVFILPIFVYVLYNFGRNDIVEIIINAILHRIFIVPAEVLYQYFKIFPDIHGFLLGRSTNLTAWMFAEGLFPTNNYVMAIWWNQLITTGSANAIYFGKFWADYGIFGVLISTILVGITIHLLYWKILDVSRYTKDIIYVSFICYLVPIFTINFFSANFTTLFFTKGIIFIIFYLFFFQHFRDQIKSTLNSNI